MFAYVALSCQVAVAGVFVLSFVSKVRGPSAYHEFTLSVAALSRLPRAWVRPAALALIVAEGSIALLVAVPSRGSAGVGLVGAMGLLTVFTSGIVAAMRRGSQVPCRCFGASATPLGLPHVIRNLVLLAVCGVALVGVGSGAAADGRLTIAGVVFTVAAAIISVLFIQRLDDIVVLFAPEPGAGSGSR